MDAGTWLWKSIQRYICTVTVKSYVWTPDWTWTWILDLAMAVFAINFCFSSWNKVQQRIVSGLDALHCLAGVAQESTLQQCSNAFPQKWRSAIRKELLAKTSWLVSAKQKRQHIHSSYPVPKQSSIIFLDPPALQPTYEVKKWVRPLQVDWRHKWLY